MRRAVIILATLGILAWAGSQAQADDHHGYRHGHHGSVGVYYGPAAPRVYAYPAPVVVVPAYPPPPFAVYPPAYVMPRPYYEQPGAYFQYYGRGLSVGIGF
jgi:hypothetical protein